MHFIPLVKNQKYPTSDAKAWTTALFPFETIEEHVDLWLGNYGVRLSAADLVIDIDVKYLPPNEGREEFIAGFIARYGLQDAYRVRTQGGGVHIFLRKDPSIGVAKHSKTYGKVVEFKTAGTYVVGAGSIFEGREYKIEHAGSVDIVCPEALFQIVRKDLKPKVESVVKVISLDYMKTLLDALEPTDFTSNDDWLTVAMAVHSGSAGEAIDLFAEWSRKDPAFDSDSDESDVRARWASFNGTGVNVYKLLELIKKSGKPVPQEPAADTFADLDLSGEPEFIRSNEYRGFFKNFDLVEVDLSDDELISKIPKLKKKYGVKELTIDEIADEDRRESADVF